MSIEIFVIKALNGGEYYGSFHGDKDSGERVVGSFPVRTDECNYGYPVDVEATLLALRILDDLSDNCHFQDLLMVFFSAGLAAGIEIKQNTLKEELGICS